ncbi:MAG: pyridoxal phosphate-dependent decarboxylase family protein, partial [Limisphaerales bacterium]
MQHRQQQSLGDTPPAEFRKQLHKLADWIADFREHIEQLRVAPDDKPGAIRAQIPKRAPDEGESFERILSDVDGIIVPGMVHWSHPMFLGYFGWTATGPGILGEILSAPLNVNAMTWRTCPAATELETVVVDWLRQWLGLADKFDGVVYDTASVGIMHALAVAREEAAASTRQLGLTNRDLPRLRIYTSDQAHSAAEKAAITLGIGEENVIRIPSDEEFRMDIKLLGQTIAHDRQ